MSDYTGGAVCPPLVIRELEDDPSFPSIATILTNESPPNIEIFVGDEDSLQTRAIKLYFQYEGLDYRIETTSFDLNIDPIGCEQSAFGNHLTLAYNGEVP